MSCTVCGAEPAAEGRCRACGYPEVPEAAARALAEARNLVAAGAIDQSIRLIHSAVKAAPDSALVHLRLAEAYERKVQGGEAALTTLADREFREALRLAPADRDVHVARLALWARTGRAPLLKREYASRREELPFADECLRILGTLENTGAVTDAVAASTGEGELHSRLFLFGAFGLGAVGLVELGVVIMRAIGSEEYEPLGHPDFYVAVGCLTAAGIFVLEGMRARKKRGTV